MTVKMFHDRFTHNDKHANDTLFAKKLSASTKYVMPNSLGTYLHDLKREIFDKWCEWKLLCEDCED